MDNSEIVNNYCSTIPFVVFGLAIPLTKCEVFSLRKWNITDITPNVIF